MKPGTIKTSNGIRAHKEDKRILRWLKANGLRHHIPEDARIIITGNRVIVPTLDIERTDHPPHHAGQSRPWYLNRTRDYFIKNRDLPRKVRTYRIRQTLEDTP